jgi:hypothetical protein
VFFRTRYLIESARSRKLGFQKQQMSLFGLEMFEVLVVAAVMAGVAIRQMFASPGTIRRRPLLLRHAAPQSQPLLLTSAPAHVEPQGSTHPQALTGFPAGFDSASMHNTSVSHFNPPEAHASGMNVPELFGISGGGNPTETHSAAGAAEWGSRRAALAADLDRPVSSSATPRTDVNTNVS